MSVGYYFILRGVRPPGFQGRGRGRRLPGAGPLVQYGGMAPEPTSRPGWGRRGARVAFLLAGTLLAAYLMFSPRTAEWFLFLPDASDPGEPPALGGVDGTAVPGRTVEIETPDGVRIHGWWWEAAPEAPAILFLHGNAGNIGGRLQTAEGLVARGVSTFLLDYRGYGRSGGSPSEEGIRLDGEAALGWVAGEVGGPGRVVVHGRSLGGVVGAELAARRPVAGVILESTFTTLREMASAVYPFIPSILLRRLRGHYDALAAVGRIEAPILLIHGTADRLVPIRMGEALRARAGTGARWVPVEGAGHNDLPWVGGSAYFDRVAGFVREVTAVTPPDRGEPEGG